MATTLLMLNNLNFIAMNRKAAVRHSSYRYHEEGIGTVTIFLALVTIGIIFYSIYSAL